MITIDTLYTIQILQGLSTDSKPVDGVPNGSIYIEMDTAKKYRFDKENEIWLDYDNPSPGGDNVVIYCKYDNDSSTMLGYKDADLTPFTSTDDAKQFIGNNSIVLLDVDDDSVRMYPIAFRVAGSPAKAALDVAVYNESFIWFQVVLYRDPGSPLGSRRKLTKKEE